MGLGTMAIAVVVAVLIYYVFNRRSASSGNLSKMRSARKRRWRKAKAQAPATWLESLYSLSEMLRFTYSESLGKWPIVDLTLGIYYHMRRQGSLQVASVYAGSDSVQLKGPGIIEELHYYLKLLTLCMHFSKKSFLVFLESGGFSQEDVLLREPDAGLMKPAFTVIRDKNSKCFLLLIRGTHSISDALTAATGAGVPFRHSVLHDGGKSNSVPGYAHCGMVGAARWISDISTPCLLKAVGAYPDYKIKVIGHSLGGGTAALLTYILREQKEFSSSTCVTFAPAACITWELAEFGKHFITTIINGSDLVPTLSVASVNDLLCEVTASSWLNDLRDRVEHRVLNVVSRSAMALGSSLPFIASAKTRVAGYGALLRPVSSSKQVASDGELWEELEKELTRWENDVNVEAQEEEADLVKEIIDELKMLVDAENNTPISSSDVSESHRFYPPGRILHIISAPSSDSTNLDHDEPIEEHVGIYETPREQYNKLRLSKTMINDHYLRMYKKMMELLIRELKNDEPSSV